MTLHICYSNQLEALADALCEDLQTTRRRGLAGVFTPAEIIVPNYNVGAYLKLAIAQRLGVAANLHVQFLQSFIAARVPQTGAAIRTAGADSISAPGPELDSDPGAPELRVIDTPRLHALLCTALTDEVLLADPDLAPVQSYLHAGGTDPDSVDTRRYQLAEQLATLFSDYSLSRPAMLRAWMKGQLTLQETRGGATETWQRKLFLAIFGPWGATRRIAGDSGVEWVTGPVLFDRVLAKDLGLPRHIFMAGFSYVPWAHHQILSRMARAADVHVYAVNPCMEFWEDLQSGWEERMAGRQLKKRVAGQVQLSFGDIEDTPALRLWGRPGRENIRTLNELSQCDFRACFVDPTEDCGRVTMLGALQRDILFRQPERTEPDPDIDPDDDTIRVLGCPSIQRELEVVGNEIWRLIHLDPTLRFNDIAVLVSRADQELYQAHIPAVFGELHNIPHHLVDMPLTGESRIIEAFELLLELPFGRFTRPELLRILTHPAVLARYPDVDPSDWIHWSERLGIVHGADHADHAGTYIDKDVFNWDQGIRRLALGAFMAAERSGDNRSIHLGESAYLPEELPADLLPSAARFALIARSLVSDARYCRDAVMPLSQWRVFCELLVSSYLAPVDGDDERNLGHCRDAIATLAQADIDGRPVSYRIACQFVRKELSGLKSAMGEYLAHGVTVAPLLPMRPIPYRVIFLVGMGEGRFPATERDSPLDLRAVKRRRGDVAPRERDRYLFLETVLAARDRLYLTYVSRNDQTGETLQPSSVILELSHILRRGYASGNAAEGITIHHPLRRYDPRYFPALFAATDASAPGEAPLVSVAPSAHRQAHALALRRHLEGKLREKGQDMPTFTELRRALKAPRFAALRQRLGLVDITATGERDDEDSTVSISLAMVRKFLECPLQAWASAVLRLRESEISDLVARQDEVFATPVAPMVGMLRDVFTAHLAGDDRSMDALVSQYNQRAEHLELTGNAPIGVFSDVERDKHTRILQSWHQHLDALTGGGSERFCTYSFGRAGEHSAVDELLAPIALTIELPDAAGQTRPVRVELFGRTEAVGQTAVGSLILSHSEKSDQIKLRRYLLRGFVDQLAMSAAGVAPARDHKATVLSAGEQSEQFALAPWQPDEARGYLGALITDMLGSSHEYLLPCEAVFEQQNKPESSIYRIVEKLKASGRGYSSLYGPVTQLDNLPVPYDAGELIERRFGPLLAHLREQSDAGE